MLRSLHVFALAAVLPCLLLVSGVSGALSNGALHECKNALMTCENGGTISSQTCEYTIKRGSVCQDYAWTTPTVCSCRPGFMGPSCEIVTDPQMCSARKVTVIGEGQDDDLQAHSFSTKGSIVYSNDPLEQRGAQHMTCFADEAVKSNSKLSMHDHRLEVKLELAQQRLHVKMFSRDVENIVCSDMFVAFDCMLSDCAVKQTSQDAVALTCSTRTCAPMNDLAIRHRPVWSGIYSGFITNGRDVDLTISRRQDGPEGNGQASVEMHIPISFMKIKSTAPVFGNCLVGGCIRAEMDAAAFEMAQDQDDISRIERSWTIVVMVLVSIFCVATFVATVSRVRTRRRSSVPPLLLKLLESKTSRTSHSSALSSDLSHKSDDLDAAKPVDKPVEGDGRPRLGMAWEHVSVPVPTSFWLRCFRRFFVRGAHNASLMAREHLIYHQSGSVFPGEFAALIAPSGAGKSVLLDALMCQSSDFVTRTADSSKSPSSGEGRGRVRYVRDTDTFLGSMSVWETLRFAAVTRLPRSYSGGLSPVQVQQRVAEVLLALGLSDVSANLVSTLSGGQRKRLALAVEMVSLDRDVLMVDGPTKGLDSGTAETVLQALRNRSRAPGAGAVFISLDQPPVSSLQLLDRVVLMTKTGRLCFDGTPADAIEFVKNHVADRTVWNSHQEDRNPFELVLDALAEVDDEAGVEDTFLKSAAGKEASDRRSQLWRSSEKGNGRISDTLHLGRRMQIRELCSRSFHQSVRDRSQFVMYNAITAVVALCFGLVFYGAEQSMSGVRARFGFVLCSVLCLSMLCLSSISTCISERIIFYRERAAGCYTSSSYFISKVVIDFFCRCLPAMVFAVISYGLVGMRMSVAAFVQFVLLVVLVNLVASASIFVISLMSSNARTASFASVIFILFNFVIGSPLLNKGSASAGVTFGSCFCFFHYAVEALLLNELASGDIDIQMNETLKLPGELVLYLFGLPSNVLHQVGVDAGVFNNAVTLMAVCLVLYAISFLLLKFKKCKLK